MSTAQTTSTEQTSAAAHNTMNAEHRMKMLEHACENRALLLRGFSHDLKNPLGAADGFLELLEMGYRGQLAPAQQDGVLCARRSLKAAMSLLQDLFDLVRAGTGSIDVKIELADVEQGLLNVVEEHRAGAETRAIQLDARIAAQLPPIETDASRVRQIVENLLSNALKYTQPGGSVCLRAELRWDIGVPARRWLAVDVIDNGPGIAPEDQVMAFREFARLGKADVPGTGIGLAISQRVAFALGGRITLRSKVGQGSTFTLWLPLV